MNEHIEAFPVWYLVNTDSNGIVGAVWGPDEMSVMIFTDELSARTFRSNDLMLKAVAIKNYRDLEHFLRGLQTKGWTHVSINPSGSEAGLVSIPELKVVSS